MTLPAAGNFPNGDDQGMSDAALLFQFTDEGQARIARDTLEELGYDPQLHEGGRLHIHVVDEDLTSALEIVQSCGGSLVEQSRTDVAEVTSAAYGLDCIPIPAHIVNEDWRDEYASEAFTPDDGSYDHFDAR